MYYEVFHSTEHYEEKSICKIRKKNETRIFKNNMHLYAYKFENLDTMDNFQGGYKIPNL